METAAGAKSRITQRGMVMTQKEAIALAKTEFWKGMTYRELATFQLFEEKICMPFDVFHEATEKSLGRPVWTHEFASPGRLRKELLGESPAPSMKEIIELIPADKRIVVVVPD